MNVPRSLSRSPKRETYPETPPSSRLICTNSPSFRKLYMPEMSSAGGGPWGRATVTFGSDVGLPVWPMAGMHAARRTKTSAMILSVVIEFLKSIIASTGRKDQVSKVHRKNKNQNLAAIQTTLPKVKARNFRNLFRQRPYISLHGSTEVSGPPMFCKLRERLQVNG